MAKTFKEYLNEKLDEKWGPNKTAGILRGSGGLIEILIKDYDDTEQSIEVSDFTHIQMVIDDLQKITKKFK